ncbi:MAG: 4Fe-4S binding protein [Saccharofermentanales bacterium]
MAPVVESTKCDGCGKCKEVCPVDAIIFEDGKAYITVDCIECCACLEPCPANAIFTSPD